MKNTNTYQYKALGIRVRRIVSGGIRTMAVAILSTIWGVCLCTAQDSDADVQGVQVLTRGPVHEAFAGIVSFNPVAGILVQKVPPVAIEEIPPGERPVGDNITWIPGYWAWDDERSDFLWVSGTWRALPPGRQWIAGYWASTSRGYQWTSGYWADAALQETTYLPAPPATVEEGPSIKAPSSDYGWTPGNWIWRQERYAWSPGYWAQGRADWDWMPAHYVWTPRGYIYVDGYRDYSVERRGTLFAPVYFDSGVYSHAGYRYSPSIVLGLAMFAEHLFLRPNYQHYYFGDYYDNRYNKSGYYSATAYKSNRYGYDPIYSHQRWEHRDDQGWDQRAQENYRYRSDHQNARPPHTWTDMRKIDANSDESKKHGTIAASPIDQLVKRKEGPVRFQSVEKEDRKMLERRGEEIRKFSNERRSLEAKVDEPNSIAKPGDAVKITKTKVFKSPIVAKSAREFKISEAPPASQKSVQTDRLDKQPKLESGDRPQKIDKIVPQVEPRKPESTLKPKPEKTDSLPREKKLDQLDRPTKDREQQMPPTPERKVKEAPEKVKEQPAKVKGQIAPPKNVEKKAQPAPERRVRETPEKAREQPQRRAPEKAPQSETRQAPKEKSPSNPNETEQPGKKDRKKDSPNE